MNPSNSFELFGAPDAGRFTSRGKATGPAVSYLDRGGIGTRWTFVQ